MEHYLDNAATTKVCDEAIEAATFAMKENYGNPSSTHTKGREAKKLLDECRKTVADTLGCNESEIVFTSSGSESDNWAIINSARANKKNGKHIISSIVEHDAVKKSLDVLEKEGFEITRLSPNETGVITLDSVLSAIKDDTILISLMMVNNETGAVTDIKEIATKVKEDHPNILIHTDAVQGFKKIPFKAKTLNIDMISISGHKIHATKGIGALYIKDKIKLPPFIVGGEQENGKRASTEALPQIAAFAAACKEDSKIDYIKSLKEDLIDKLKDNIPEIKYIVNDAPHILNISMPGWKSEVLMNFLEEKEVYVSKSSACKQGKRSQVLEALNLDSRYIDGSLRIGLSRYNTTEDINALVEGLKEARNLMHN